MQKAFHLELDRCTGCSACQIACQIENDLPDGTSWRRVFTFNEPRVPSVPQFHLSLACNHCLDAPCEKNCPALAYDKDPRTGAVTIDPERCIGCKYCSWACPYDAPQFNGDAGVMEKCTFCSHRLAEELEPACTTSCPTGALRFGDYETSDVAMPVPGFYRESIQPAIKITPLQNAPAADTAVGRVDWLPGAVSDRSKVSLRSEWSLLVFTTVAPILVGLVASGKSSPLLVALMGLLAMSVSAAHLGRPERAYRAVLNWRRSWLSREVFLFPAFIALSLFPGARWPAAVVGFLALFAMDQVYRLKTNRRRGELSSAGVLLTGVFWAAVFAELSVVAVPLAALKLVLYLERRLGSAKERPLLFGARLVLGFVIPAATLAAGAPFALAAASLVAGEIVDRAEFYLELDFVAPATEMARELERAVGHGWSPSARSQPRSA